jgi:hypothetical protein
MIWYLILIINTTCPAQLVVPMKSEEACMNAAVTQIQEKQSGISNIPGHVHAYCANSQTGQILPDKDGKW